MIVRKDATYEEFMAVCDTFGVSVKDAMDGNLKGAKWPGRRKADAALRMMVTKYQHIPEGLFPEVLGVYVRANTVPIEDVADSLGRLARSCRRVLRFRWFWKAVEKAVRWKNGR